MAGHREGPHSRPPVGRRGLGGLFLRAVELEVSEPGAGSLAEKVAPLRRAAGDAECRLGLAQGVGAQAERASVPEVATAAVAPGGLRDAHEAVDVQRHGVAWGGARQTHEQPLPGAGTSWCVPQGPAARRAHLSCAHEGPAARPHGDPVAARWAHGEQGVEPQREAAGGDFSESARSPGGGAELDGHGDAAGGPEHAEGDVRKGAQDIAGGVYAKTGSRGADPVDAAPPRQATQRSPARGAVAESAGQAVRPGRPRRRRGGLGGQNPRGGRWFHGARAVWCRWWPDGVCTGGRRDARGADRLGAGGGAGGRDEGDRGYPLDQRRNAAVTPGRHGAIVAVSARGGKPFVGCAFNGGVAASRRGCRR